MALLFSKKTLSALLRGIISKHNSNFNCLNCLHSFSAKNKLESHGKVCENKDFCGAVKPCEDTKVLKEQYTEIGINQKQQYKDKALHDSLARVWGSAKKIVKNLDLDRLGIIQNFVRMKDVVFLKQNIYQLWVQN